jgi:hypothetical protein
MRKSNYDGWTATTVVTLEGMTREESGQNLQAQLKIRTRKSGTNAAVSWIGNGVEQYAVFQDYLKRLPACGEIKRSTDKAITQEHENILKAYPLEWLERKAREHYATNNY